MLKFKAIGDRLRQLRGALSQQEFARRIGTSFRAYQYYESGQRMPKGDVLHRISSIKQIPVDWILSGEVRGPTEEDARESIRDIFYREGIEYTEADVEAHVPAWMNATVVKDSARAVYEDASTVKLLSLLKELDTEGRADLVKYAEFLRDKKKKEG